MDNSSSQSNPENTNTYYNTSVNSGGFFSFLKNSKNITIIILLLIITAIPLTVFIAQKQQETRQRAYISPLLALKDSTTNTNNRTVNVNDEFTVNVVFHPGDQSITSVIIPINFPSDKLQLTQRFTSASTNPFTEGSNLPDANNITTANSVYYMGTSSGNTPDIVILGTIKFKALTTGTADIFFGDVRMTILNQVSGYATLGTNENASYTINAAPTLTPTSAISPTPTTTITPSSTDTPTTTTSPVATLTPSSTITSSPSPTPVACVLPAVPTGSTILGFTINLSGIGRDGNRNPTHASRDLTAQIYDSNNQLVGRQDLTAPLCYDYDTGTFRGNITTPANFVSGNYTIKVKVNKYLRKLIPGILTLTAGSSNTIPPITLVAGDINGDNLVDINDYTIYATCFAGKANSSDCRNALSTNHLQLSDLDLNDDGKNDDRADLSDYKILIQSFATRQGD